LKVWTLIKVYFKKYFYSDGLKPIAIFQKDKFR